MRTVYSWKMDEVKAFVGEQAMDLNGDGRFDSPGHLAMYGTYSMMDSETKLIVACQVVKVFMIIVVSN